MKTIFAIAVTVVVGISLPAGSQTQPNIAMAPADRSTGPTVPDARSVNLGNQPSSGAVPSTPGSSRVSDSVSNDPNNPTGAPSLNAGLGSSPTR